MGRRTVVELDLARREVVRPGDGIHGGGVWRNRRGEERRVSIAPEDKVRKGEGGDSLATLKDMSRGRRGGCEWQVREKEGRAERESGCWRSKIARRSQIFFRPKLS